MNTYQLETVIEITGNFFAADGVTPVDPSAVYLFVRTPDGIITEYSGGQITQVSMGVYSFSLETTQAGPYIYKWQGTGAVEITSPDVYFTVAQSALEPLA